MATCTDTHREPVSFGIDAIELAPLPRTSTTSIQRKLGISDPESVKEEAIPPLTAVNALQKWNSPRVNIERVFACFWSFLVLGMNDGSYGVRCHYAIELDLLKYRIGSDSICTVSH
jgi:hypothetical protein